MAKIQRVFYTGTSCAPLDGQGSDRAATNLSKLIYVGFDTGVALAPAKGDLLTIAGGGAWYVEGVFDSTGGYVYPTDSMPADGMFVLHSIVSTDAFFNVGDLIQASGVTLATVASTLNDYIPEVNSPLTTSRGVNQLRGNFRKNSESPVYAGYIGDFAVGVPIPIETPTVNVSGEADPLDLDADSRTYVMTYVNEIGYESAPGPASDTPIHVIDTTNVNIVIPQLRAVKYTPTVYGRTTIVDYVPIVAARLYRTNTGTAQTGFQLIAEVRLTDFTVTIPDVANSELGELLITDSWDVPPPVVTAGTKMTSGVYILGYEYDIYLSVPGVVYAYPVIFSQKIKDEIVAIEAIGTNALILTTGAPYIVVGSSPDVMELVKLPSVHPCINQKSVQVFAGLLIYPSYDGLIGVNANGQVRNLTKDIYDSSEWRQTYDLGTCVSALHDGVYYLWDNTGLGFAFDFTSRELSPINGLISQDAPQIATLFDGYSNILYTREKSNTALRRWEPLGAAGFVNAIPWQWTSKEFYVPDRSYGAIKVTGIFDASNSVGISVYIDGVVYIIGTAVNDTPLRLPAVRGAKYKVKLETIAGAPEVHSLQVTVHATEMI